LFYCVCTLSIVLFFPIDIAMSENFGRPNILVSAIETPRAIGALFRLALSAIFGRAFEAFPDGKGQPVLLLHAFLSHRTYLSPLRLVLQSRGYNAHLWDHRRRFNTGASEGEMQALVGQLERISQEHQGQKVSIVGHSLGGLIGLELAHRCPRLVDRVIMLGSPIMGGEHPKAIVVGFLELFHWFNGRNTWLLEPRTSARLLSKPPVPVTAVYTLGDGFVNGRICYSDVLGEKNRVRSGHMGLPFHPEVVRLILKEIGRGAFESLSVVSSEAGRLADFGKGSFVPH
jgi:triacylglycerol lipase